MSKLNAIRRILVPVDFSEASLAALGRAAELARKLRARVDIVHVMEPLMYAAMIGPPVDLDRIREQYRRAARERLAELERKVARKRLRCRTELRAGSPALVIADVAKRAATDLIVIASQGRHGLGHALLGSVTARVVRTAPCAVLVVRAPGAKPRTTNQEVQLKIRRILAPTDFSPLSESGVNYAAKLARTFGAELVLFHAVEPVVMAGDFSGSLAVGQIIGQMERSARDLVSRRVRKLEKRGLRCRGTVVIGMAGMAIADGAAKVGADVIVMATHGRTGLSHLFLGSVAERTVRSAPCAVLTVPARRAPSEAKRREPVHRTAKRPSRMRKAS